MTLQKIAVHGSWLKNRRLGKLADMSTIVRAARTCWLLGISTSFVALGLWYELRAEYGAVRGRSTRNLSKAHETRESL